MTDDAALGELAQIVARHFVAAGWRVVTAESCTGGWLAKTLTDLAGSSRWFECGYVTYSNEAKARDLAVSIDTLSEHGAVSEACALEMASGAARRTAADVAIAITGIAGPDGGSIDKPVGTVWFALAVAESAAAEARMQRFSGDREAIRRQCVRYALEWLVGIQFPHGGTTV